MPMVASVLTTIHINDDLKVLFGGCGFSSSTGRRPSSSRCSPASKYSSFSMPSSLWSRRASFSFSGLVAVSAVDEENDAARPALLSCSLAMGTCGCVVANVDYAASRWLSILAKRTWLLRMVQNAAG